MFPWSSDADKIQRASEKIQRATEKFQRASENGDVAKVRALLKNGTVEINGRDESGYTPLYWVSRDGNLPIVEMLLKTNADPDKADKNGRTPIHYACMNGHLHIVDVLLKANADSNKDDTFGSTPLYWASFFGHLHIVNLLLKANANPNKADQDGDTPLHAACRTCKSEIAHALLTGSADLHAKRNDGLEPLHACMTSLRNGVSNQTLLTLQALVSCGATWDVQCDAILAKLDKSRTLPALRLCVMLWTQEHADGLACSQIPIETVDRGVRSTHTYIDTLKTSRRVVFRRKICLVGSSCAGKTSFVKSITSERLEPQLAHDDDRTIGIDHFPLCFEQPVAGSNQVKIHEVTFWDFAGQDAYQVAHSLFFSPRTLFLVCVDLEAFTTAFLQASIMADMKKQETQLMDEFIERTVMRWIRLIVARQPDADFVFIATKEDLLKENNTTEDLLKKSLVNKLKRVKTTVQEMKKEPTTDERPGHDSTILFASSTSPASVGRARDQIEDLIIKCDRSFQMPDTYSQVLKTIVERRESAKRSDITTRIHRVFAPVDTLASTLNIESDLCRIILQTLHDLGDVLWYEDLGVDLFQNTVILDPLLLIDFIRQVINHKHTGVTMPHADLKSKPFWRGLSSQQQIQAMKQVLQTFHLVYSADDDRTMAWDSDLIVPAFWQTKTPAAWLFLGDMLRINTPKTCAGGVDWEYHFRHSNKTKSREGEAVRVHWEYHFEFGLPSSLFDHVVVASVSPYAKFDAGPDWIVYEETGVAACRIMVGRDLKSLHRTVHVEAVVAVTASHKQVHKLWRSFRHLCGAFFRVLREYPGLAVSSFAWDDEHAKFALKRLMQSPPWEDSAAWMPPATTWEWLRNADAESHGSGYQDPRLPAEDSALAVAWRRDHSQPDGAEPWGGEGSCVDARNKVYYL